MLSVEWSSATHPPDWVRIGLCPVCGTSVLVDDEFVRVRGTPRHLECVRYLRGRRAGGVVRVRGGPRAAAETRDELSARSAALEAPLRAQADLLLTELVTNAVRHGGAHRGETVDVVFQLSNEWVRVAVTDPGSGFEWRPAEATREPRAGGYGLVLVDEIARRWGIERRGDRNVVWFEIEDQSVS